VTIENSDKVYPVLPLRDVVVYPHMVIPLFVGRDKSVQALDRAMDGNKQILLAAQKSASEDDPKIDEIYRIGTLSNILQLLKLPDGTIKVLVEGAKRVKIIDFIETDSTFSATAELLEPIYVDDAEVEIFSRSVMNQFERYVKLNKKVPPQINNIFAVFTCKNSCCGCLRPPCGGTEATVPSMSFKSACCTPSPETGFS